MDKNARIFIAGHKGLVGGAIVRQLQAHGYKNLILRTRNECDLSKFSEVDKLFTEAKPQYIFLAAAKVGGILANSQYPADFILQNLKIQNNIVQLAYEHNVKRLLFLGSSCIYPRDCPQPMTEASLLTGPLEPTNRPYALAKIAGIELCWAYNRQYNCNYLAVMPTNLYGPGDNYNLKTSHVIPALIRKMHEAKINDSKTVEVWGTGAPRREFLFCDDLADASVFLMQLEEQKFYSLVGKDSQDVPPIINIGVGKDQTIKELATLIAEVVGFRGELKFNTSMPDGTPQKLLSVEKIHNLGWQARVDLRSGLKQAYAEYIRQAIPELSGA